MKILHIYRTFFPDTQGGLEEVVRQIAIGTRALGAEVRVLTLSKMIDRTDVVDVSGIQVIRIPEAFEVASCNVAFRDLGTVREQIDWADLLHFHFPWPFADLVNALWGAGKPRVLTYHSDIVRQKGLLSLYRPLMRSFLKSMDRIIATSPDYLDSSPVLQAYRDKTTVVPLGVEPDSYPEPGAERMAQWQDRIGAPFLLFVGVLRYYKGLRYLLEAARGADYSIVIAGKGPREIALKAQAERLGLDNIVWTGFIDDTDKVALLRLCQGLVFPSCERSEAFGVTLLEGAMSGKPLISCEIGTGTSYVNRHGETGLVVPPADPAALRRAMDSLMADPERARVLGDSARKRFHRLFTGEKMAKSCFDIYEQLLHT